MYLVAGSNIFGQWMSEDNILKRFTPVTVDEKRIKISNSSQFQVVHISWSYNIINIDNDLYVTGTSKGLDNTCIPLKLPEELKTMDMLISGNDYHLALMCKSSQSLWIINLENENDVKKLCLNIETPLENPKKMRMGDKVLKMVTMNDMCLYLTSSGSVYSGKLPSYVDTSHCIGKVCDVQCGYEHCVLLTDAGRVYTWGNGWRLQLGNGDVNSQEIPTELEALAGLNVVKICAGGWHTLALSEFGDLYAWGWNDTGQLGIRENNTSDSGLKSQEVPTLVDIYDGNCIVEINIKDIACGSKHSMILLEDNSVWTTGCNKYGQLGFSPDVYVKVNYFKKTYQNNKITELFCGPWCSVIKYT